MTAAVARPPLFRHLLASNPEHQKGSFAATTSAVLLHAGFVVAAVALTARVQTAPDTNDIREVVPIAQYIPESQERAHPGGGSPSSGPVAPVFGKPVEFTPTTEVPTTIPPAGSMGDLMKVLDQLMAARPATGPGVGTARGDNPGDFVPITVAPELQNRTDVARAMLRLYPETLMQAGIGGTVLVWLRLDENGSVTETRLKQTSGHSLLDEAALKVAQTARFSPAYNRDQKVRVWVELPIVFATR